MIKIKKIISKSLLLVEKALGRLWAWCLGLLLASKGPGCTIAYSAKIKNPYKVRLGSKVKIHEYVIISAAWESGEVHLENNVKIYPYASIFTFGGKVHLKSGISIGPYCLVYGHGGLIIGENTMVAGHCKFIPAEHNFSDTATLIRHQGVTKKGIISW